MSASPPLTVKQFRRHRWHELDDIPPELGGLHEFLLGNEMFETLSTSVDAIK
jgi:hypothetical protein